MGNSKIATVTFPGRNKFTTKIKKLAKEYPDEVAIVYTNTDGSIVARIPVKYIKISHPRSVSREYTEEQKEELRQRMKRIQEERNKNKSV